MPAKPKTIRSILVRLDADLLAQLERAADAMELSREGYLRRLIANQFTPHGHRHSSTTTQRSRAERYAPDTTDRRVLRAREKAKTPNKAGQPTTSRTR